MPISNPVGTFCHDCWAPSAPPQKVGTPLASPTVFGTLSSRERFNARICPSDTRPTTAGSVGNALEKSWRGDAEKAVNALFLRPRAGANEFAPAPSRTGERNRDLS